MLSQIGCVALPHGLLNKLHDGEPLTDEEQQQYREHPNIATALLSNVPRLKTVSKIIARQFSEIPAITDRTAFRRQETTAIGSQLLKTALDYDYLTTSGVTPETTVENMKEAYPEIPAVPVQSLAAVLGIEENEHDRRSVRIDEIRPGMIIDEDVYAESGMLLAVKGTELSENMTRFLVQFASKDDVRGPFGVLVPRG
jgi:hypothetical protein